MSNKEIAEEVRKLVHEFNRNCMINKTHVEVYGLDSNDSQYGINWGAIGTVSITETKWFIDELNKAIGFVNKVNDMLVRE